MNKLIGSHLQEMIPKEWDFNDLYNFIKKNPPISAYRNGKNTFFAAAGKIHLMSEFIITFFIYTITFFGVIGLQKILKKIRKQQGLNVRGGQNF